MADVLMKCHVGELTDTECHKKTFVSKVDLKNMEDLDLSENEREILSLRTGKSWDDLQIGNICLHHIEVLLKRYEFMQKKCSDPLKKHQNATKTKQLRTVSLQMCKQFLMKGIKVKPGQKLCTQCRRDMQEYQGTMTKTDVDEVSEEICYIEDELEQLNTSFTKAGCSPMKLHSLPQHSRAPYGCRKLESFESTVREKMSKVLKVDLPSKKSEKVDQIVARKVADLDLLTKKLKDKLKVVSMREKIQILTIPAAMNWSRKKIQEQFEVSEYCVRQAQKQTKESRILSLPPARQGRTMSPETIQLVTQFYEDNEQSRLLPGMKDVVSLGKKQYMRRRLLLGNLHEIYASFVREHPHVKIGFSKFCILRPKWCILAGASGTHSVCVCTKHQNTILLIHAANLDQTYKDMIAVLVCNKENRDCMLRYCPNCPPKETLIDLLQSKLEDYDPGKTIEYKQWVATDRSQLTAHISTLEEFVHILTDQVDKLVSHSFIAKSQSTYFKNLKETCNIDTAVVTMDFSENYAFVIQDEAQGYHWTHASCTIHSLVIHYQEPGGTKRNVSSHCLISDDLQHDVEMVYKTQEIIINFLKTNMPHIKKLHYFSDGCAAQYKNKYNFANLCCHETDFHLKADWSFFATSHGKTECDGIGGTAKRLARKESLQSPLDRQLTNAVELFEFCRSSIKKINFSFVSKTEMDSVRNTLHNRFKDVHTLPGTQSFHNFIPVSSTTVEARRISSDGKPSLVFNLYDPHTTQVTTHNIFPHCYVACKYDDSWFFALVEEVKEDEGTVSCRFLHPKGPSPSFYWPQGRDDVCDVPLPHIISVVEAPGTTASGRMYYFSQQSLKTVQKNLTRFSL